MIEARRQLASKNITDSENAKKEAYERLIEAEQKRMEAYEQAQFIIDKANKTSVIEHDKILQRAQAAAELIIKKAKNDIIGIQNSLLEEANKKIIDVTYYAVNEILKKEVTRVENDKIINDFIAKYEQGNEIKK
jgi:F-type H+-transporting ATPase subunit b